MIIIFSFRKPSHSLRFTRWFTAFNALKPSVYHTIFKLIIYHGSWIFRYEYLSYRKIIIYSPKLPSKIFCRFIRLWPHECQRTQNFILIIIFAHNSYFFYCWIWLLNPDHSGPIETDKPVGIWTKDSCFSRVDRSNSKRWQGIAVVRLSSERRPAENIKPLSWTKLCMLQLV